MSQKPALQAPFRTAIVGNIQALNVLLPAFQSVPDFQVTALCGRELDRVPVAAKKAGIAKVYEGWEPLVTDPEIDVVAIALPPALQAKAAVKLAAAGKHLLLEKPLAANLKDAKSICAAVDKAGVKATVNFGFRMIEAFRDFHAVCQSGVLGRLESVMVEWLASNRRDPSYTWNWKSDLAQGGGTLSMVGVHVFDYLRWCFGDVSNIQLQTAALIPKRPDDETKRPKPVTADDTCNLQMVVTPNAPVSAAISTAVAVPTGHCIRAWFEHGLLTLANGPADDFHDGFTLSFQPAKGSPTGLQEEVERLAKSSSLTPHAPGKVTISARVAREFAAMIQGKRSDAPTLAEALRVQEDLDAARRSAP